MIEILYLVGIRAAQIPTSEQTGKQTQWRPHNTRPVPPAAGFWWYECLRVRFSLALWNLHKSRRFGEVFGHNEQVERAKEV